MHATVTSAALPTPSANDQSYSLMMKAQILVALSESVQKNVASYEKMMGPSPVSAGMDELWFQIGEIFDSAVLLAGTHEAHAPLKGAVA